MADPFEYQEAQPFDVDEAIARLANEEPYMPAEGRDGDSEDIGGFTINWRTLADEDAPERWDALRGFVEWLCERYTLPAQTVPDCWWRHSALVEELSALFSAHDALFHTTDAGLGPIGWHERFQLSLERMKRAHTCSRVHSEVTAPRTITTEEAAWQAWRSTTHSP